MKAVRYTALSQLAQSHAISFKYVNKDNIMIDVDGRARIGDFGCARTSQYSLSVAEMTSTPKGTLPYWAPELIDSNTAASYSKITDIWALGMTIYVRKLLLSTQSRSLNSISGDHHPKKAFSRQKRRSGHR